MKSEADKEKSRADKAEMLKLKVHKDLGFLLKYKPIFISRSTAKYILD